MTRIKINIIKPRKMKIKNVRVKASTEQTRRPETEKIKIKLSDDLMLAADQIKMRIANTDIV